MITCIWQFKVIIEGNIDQETLHETDELYNL